MDAPLLIMFVDIPGSGKTTFAKRLAHELGAVVLASDGMRLGMWGTLDKLQASHQNPQDRRVNNLLTFGAMDYATEQILKAGHTVIYDVNATRRAERQEKYDIAARTGARALIVRIRVPYDVSLRRIQEREATADARQFAGEEKARQVLDRFAAEIEEPEADEVCIEISGEVPFDEQFTSFQRQLAALVAAH